MSTPVRRSSFDAPSTELAIFDLDDARGFDTLDVGERMCAPAERGGSMLGATLFLLVLAGAGWGLLQTQSDWLAWLGERVAALSTPERGAAASMPVPSDASSAAAVPAPLPSAPPVETASIEVPPAPVAPPAQPVETQANIETAPVPQAATKPDEASAATAAEPAEPLPPPRVDPADPYQRRAAAVGLHPDLSRVLLAKLSAADYRNASYAIKTAVARTKDEADFVWPRQRRPEQALFRVHFVPGAAPQCRRYVVTVVKDGWSTTALPMERCGTEAGGKSSGRERSAVSAR